MKMNEWEVTGTSTIHQEFQVKAFDRKRHTHIHECIKGERTRKWAQMMKEETLGRETQVLQVFSSNVHWGIGRKGKVGEGLPKEKSCPSFSCMKDNIRTKDLATFCLSNSYLLLSFHLSVTLDTK